MKTAWNKLVTSAVMPFLLGMAAFFLIVGPRVLRPSNIAWLSSGDSSFHYLGWQFFRNAEWSFPIGLNPDYGLALSNAILFSDSNPLLAFIFKPFSSLLPEPFQYFGLWLLACFVLQAWLAWKLVGLISQYPAMRLLGAGLFVFAPPLIWRIQDHLSLVGQFLILAALYLSLRPTRHRRTALWTLVLVLAALVHAYLLAMIAVLWLADLIQVRVRRERSVGLAALEFAGVSSVIGLACWQSGYFTVGGGVLAGGYGLFRANLLAVLDANGWSYVLQDPPWAGGGFEGFSYLGLGVIVLALCALPALIGGHIGLPAALKRRALLLGALVGLALFAFSNQLGIGSLHVALPLPEPWLRPANVFRSSGRMFLPMFYALVLTIVFIAVRGNKPRTAVSLLAVALAIQVLDSRAGWQGIRDRLMTRPATEWATPLRDPFWVRAASKYRKVRSLPPLGRLSGGHWRTFGAYAGRHGLGTDAVPLTRIDPGAHKIARNNTSAVLNTGRYEADSLYVFDPPLLSLVARHIDPETDLLARIDGFYLVAPGWKRCRECGHRDRELVLADIPPLVGRGERIRFSQSGAGVAYLTAGWSGPEARGTWSNGPAAEIVLPSADAGVQAILIEADALVSPGYPRQDIRIGVNGILAATTSLRASAVNRIRVPIPAAARGELRDYGILRLEFRFPDAAHPQDEDPRSRTLGLLAITLIGGG